LGIYVHRREGTFGRGVIDEARSHLRGERRCCGTFARSALIYGAGSRVTPRSRLVRARQVGEGGGEGALPRGRRRRVKLLLPFARWKEAPFQLLTRRDLKPSSPFPPGARVWRKKRRLEDFPSTFGEISAGNSGKVIF